jgi:hypothetical protein
MRFFFDRCMSIRLARMVDIFETDHTVRHHDEDARFTPTSRDVEWIEKLAADDPAWIVISGDGRILKSRAERAALLEAKLKFFCLAKAWMNMPFAEYAWKFIRVWPEIVQNATTSKAKLFEVSGGKALKVTGLQE